MRCAVIGALVLALCSGGVVGVSAGAAPGLTMMRQFPSAVLACAARAVDGGTLVVAATSGAGLYATTPGGATFRKLSPVLDVMRVTTIEILNADSWLLGTDGDGLWRTDNAGGSFAPVTALDCSRISRIVPGAAGTKQLFIASLCTGLHASSDGGVTWKTLSNGVTSTLVADVVPMDERHIAVVTENAGLFLSSDGGASFKKSACPVGSPSAVAWDSGKSMLCVAGGTTVAMSIDGGAHWKKLPSPGPIAGLVSLPSGWLIVGTHQHGLRAWDAASGTWLSVAGSPANVSSMKSSDSSFVAGSSDGKIAVADLRQPLAAGMSLLTPDTVPANQTRSATAVLANIGGGAMTYRAVGTSQYLEASPASGTATGRAVIRISIDGTQVDRGSYQRLVKFTTDGGDVPVTIMFVVSPAEPVRISLTIGRTTGSVAGTSMTLDAAPYIDKASGRTMVPMRFIGEAFGARVEWNAASRNVTVQTDATPNHKALSMTLTIGSTKAVAGGRSLVLDAAPAIVAGRTFVPLRVISETLGAEVVWNAAARTVGISYMP